MPEIKKPSPDDIKQAFLAYEAATSPIVLAIVLGLLGKFLDKHFVFLHNWAVFFGAIIGFILGVTRLLLYLKEQEEKKN